MDDRAENDRSNEHFNQLDETVTEGLHLFSEVRIKVTQQDTEKDCGEHLGVEMRIERLAWCSRRSRCARRHDVLPSGSGVDAPASVGQFPVARWHGPVRAVRPVMLPH